MAIAIESRFREVERLVLAAQAKNLDPEVASYYCKLGCVMICGTIERSIETLVSERIGGRSVPQVSLFFRSFFKRGTNYDCEEILKLLYKFDSRWGENFKNLISKNEQVKSSVSSCYSIRNSIAHGGGLSLGPKVLKQYFDDSFILIAELEAILRA